MEWTCGNFARFCSFEKRQLLFMNQRRCKQASKQTSKQPPRRAVVSCSLSSNSLGDHGGGRRRRSNVENDHEESGMDFPFLFFPL